MNDWIAECVECPWTALTDSVRKADLKADLHTATTGHVTEVDQAE